MNNGNKERKKLRHGALSFAISAAVIAVVILLNVAATALCSGNLWYIDISPVSYYNNHNLDVVEQECAMYTLMNETVNYLDQIIDEANARRGEGEEPVQVEIIFCADPDQLKNMEIMRYVYYTALNLQKEFPETIHVSYRDVWNNPSSVSEFCTTSYSKIYQTNVIISSDSEFRVCPVREFYTYDSDSSSSEPMAYNGQKWFVKQILDVTGAASPICCLTTNHGEPFADLDLADRENWTEYRVFLDAIEDAGYEIRYLDLEKEEIPENCRLIITFDPQKDFASSFQSSEVKESETIRLNDFLAKSYSFMVFVDASTPDLPNLEEYLELWGIEFMRGEGQNPSGETVTGAYQVADSTHSLAGSGETFYAQYVPGRGLGNTILTDIISSSTMPKIYFDNAMPINRDYSSYYDTVYIDADTSSGSEAFTLGYYESNYRSYSIFDMLHVGSKDALPEYTLVNQDGEALTDENGNPIGGVLNGGAYPVMTISREATVVTEGQGYTAVTQNAYVCAVGSTAFVSDRILDTSAYGNIDVLLATLRYIGKEVNPVGLNFLMLYEEAIDEAYHSETDESTGVTKTLSSITVTTVLLAVIPAVIVVGSGITVLVKRRVRR